MAFIDERASGWVTLCSRPLPALSVFADLMVVRFDAYANHPATSTARVVGIALWSWPGSVFKAFTFYLDSAYLE